MYIQWLIGEIELIFCHCICLTAFRIGSKQVGDIKQVSLSSNKGVEKPVDVPSTNFPHLRLPDGRLVVYREQGVVQEIAQYTVFVIHGFPSSRLAGLNNSVISWSWLTCIQHIHGNNHSCMVDTCIMIAYNA